MGISEQIKRFRNELNHLRNRFNKFVNQTATSEVPGAVKLYNSLEDEHEDGAPTQKLVRDLKAELDTLEGGFRAGSYTQEGATLLTEVRIDFQTPMPSSFYSVAITSALTRVEVASKDENGFDLTFTGFTGTVNIDWQVQLITEGPK